MNPRGHRGFAAVLMLLVLVLSAMALLPARAQAATNQVTGLVSQCGSSTYIGGATVTLADADGVLSPLTTTTPGDGVFAFTPPAANYTLNATAPGYYASGITAPFRFDGSTTVSENLCLTPQLPAGKTSFTVTFHVQSASTGAYIGGATVGVYNATRQAAGLPALIATGITNGTAGANAGNVALSLWSDNDFSVQVNATGFGVYIQTMTITSAGTITVPMSVQFTVVGHATNTAGQFLSAGLTGTLYNLGTTVPKYNGTKVIPAVVSGSLYTFYAPAGSYSMIIDANGYTAYRTDLTLSGSPTTVLANAVLASSPPESYLTTVLFGAKDWNNITIYRNWTLNPDSTLAGLSPAGVRNLRDQLNFTFGNGLGDGTVSPNDVAAFTNWLRQNGPVYVTTDAFMLLNGQGYTSSVTSFVVSVSNTLPNAAGKVWINTTATYHLESTAWITYGQPKYYLNMTLFPDTNTTVYHNETYIVQLPLAYEMASDTIVPSGSITTYNFTRITVDPGLTTGTPVIRMVLQKALSGTARATVIGPAGKFYVANASFDNYQAYIAANASITFSGQQSTDPVGNIQNANFTWEFEANTNPSVVGWGITSTHEYATPGQFTVNLTVLQSGGNVTYRNITVWVDGAAPLANFKTNYTGSGSAVGMTLHINESATVKFTSLSTDLAYPGKTGVILNAGYKWVFDNTSVPDATGSTVNWTFSKPGWYRVILNVTDAVGNTGVNATMVVIVNDTQPPVPSFAILDPNNDYAPVTSLMEGHLYTFNASTTTDNYDSVSNLTFNWTIAGPIFLANGTALAGTSHPFDGMNITFGWSSWNLSYAVTLTAKDRGFGSGIPNVGTKTFNESVQIDWSKHPDLYVNVGTAKISTSSPESGQAVTITLNVTNKPSRGTASNVYVTVTEGTGSGATTLMNKQFVGNGWSMSKDGSAATTIPSGTTVTLTITVTVVGQGNKTLTVLVADTNEPYTVVTAENQATLSINVLQPAWVTYAIIGAIAGVFLVVIGAMYYRRKVKVGDWQPRFRRSKEGKGEGGKEKPKREKEVKEEKKRL